MRILKINRKHYRKFTTGRVEFEGFFCHSLELPWKNNDTDVSCIPNGIYTCRKIVSDNHGRCFEVVGVPMRTLVRGHKGNFTSDTLGCILFGDSIKDINNDGVLDVTNSTNTFNKLMSKLPQEFLLWIGQPQIIGVD